MLLTMKILFGISILIISISVGYYFLIYLPQKDQAQTAIRKNIQEAYDACVGKAENDYLNNQRSMCWKYSYDSIDCDLSFFETYKLPEAVPAKTLKNEKANCEITYPVNDREYSSTSPTYISPLAAPIGNFTEGEAFTRLNSYANVSNSFGKNIASRLQEELKLPDARSISYNVSEPSKEDDNWHFLFYQEDQDGNKNLIEYQINANTGKVISVTPH